MLLQMIRKHFLGKGRNPEGSRPRYELRWMRDYIQHHLDLGDTEKALIQLALAQKDLPHDHEIVQLEREIARRSSKHKLDATDNGNANPYEKCKVNSFEQRSLRE